jgi:N6-adenosine-specific RNA methylase IME4/predicted transcriptional regulator
VTPAEAEEYTQSLGQIGGGLWRQILWAHQQGIPAALGLSLRDWVDKRLGGYVRMAVEERRNVVAELTTAGMAQRDVADVVGVDQAQVSRDLNHDANASNQAAIPQITDAALMHLHQTEDLPDPAMDRSEQIQELARQRTPEPVSQAVPFPDGRFSCIVLDPPWPVEKVVTRARPWQGVDLDYPVMSLEEIAALPVDDLARDDAHLYLWVTHRFMPDGLRIAAQWGFRYQCLMTWDKHTGVVPYSWMYNTEHVIFASRGNLKLAKRGLRLSFDEPPVRNGHSTKPEVFYDRVRAASPERRLEMFARRERAGFIAWGNEVSA